MKKKIIGFSFLFLFIVLVIIGYKNYDKSIKIEKNVNIASSTTEDIKMSGIYNPIYIAPDKNTTAPQYHFTGDTNTGIGWEADDELGFYTGGMKKMSIDSLGALKYQGWTMATSTVVCMYPEQCEYQCDGTADDVQINEANEFTYNKGGGRVNIKNATYDITDNIVVKRGVNILGESKEGTILLLKNNATFSDAGMIRFKDISDRVQYASLKNITLDGNRDNQGTTTSNLYGVYAEGDYITVENNIIKNHVGYGVDPHESLAGEYSLYFNTLYNYIDNCGTTTNGSCGITYDFNKYGKIIGNIVTNSGHHGISMVTGSLNILIEKNIISTTTGHGISITNNCNNITIKDNDIYWAGDSGIYISSADNNNIINNTITYSYERGMRIYKSSHNNIIQNFLMYNARKEGSVDELQLDDNGSEYSTYNNVSLNHITASTARYGIREDAAGNNYNIITSNIVTGAVTGNISSKE